MNVIYFNGEKMCRLIGYIGKEELLIQDLIDKPENSLIEQSKNAQEDSYSINADGFGLAWYKPGITKNVGIFKSIQPAWNDNNLKHLSRLIKTECLIAHIRASNVGDVSFNNCHPFGHKEISFAHNGIIHGFNQIKRDLIAKIDDPFFYEIKGQTDSEHIFYLILDFLQQEKSLENSVSMAFKWIVERQKDKTDFSKLNIILTDGNNIVATRFSSKQNPNLSMYYYLNYSNIIIASEKLTAIGTTWKAVPKNHMLIYSKNNNNLTIKKILG